MSIQELAVFPWVTFNEGQGHLGLRKWLLGPNDNVLEFARIICRSHFPGYPDSIPIQVQYGAYKENVVIKRDDANIRTHETMGDLPDCSLTLVIAQYALHRMTNCWPDEIPKPWHPPGTTLSLKIRGSGQALLVTPAGMRAASAALICTPGAEAYANAMGTRLIIPITEYHISCGRMTREQVNVAFTAMDWDNYQGHVNFVGDNPQASDYFLGAAEGTLLFDGYEFTETTVCDVDEPRRYCLTACLKQRVITDQYGRVRVDKEGNPVGWNHDFIPVNGKPWAWTFISLWDNNRCVPRYPVTDFKNMFGVPESGTECECPDNGRTELGDCDVECVSTSVDSDCKTPRSVTPNIASSPDIPSAPIYTIQSLSSSLPPCEP